MIDAPHDRYRKTFVGRSRATRDLAALDAIIRDTEALTGLSGDQRGVVAERLTLYRSERTEIAAIQAGGPAAIAGWRLVEWSENNFSRYSRHFAGQSRPTRDLALLGEMVADERAWMEAMPNIDDARLNARRAQMGENLRLFTTELAAIPTSRAALSPAEQARLLAGAANTQFELYRRNFEGKPRSTRRVGLLRRVHGALVAVRTGMVALRDLGVNTAVHNANITKVGERIEHHEGELAKIRESRAQLTTGDLTRRLGDEANKFFGVYRDEFSGRPRESRDLKKLGELCDALQETARAMAELEAERPSAGNAKNIGVVLDHVKMLEREHAVIAEQRKAQAKGTNRSN